MSNNLRQIAKDLRSFVKRCKDVHYSDSLLITFLVTGLLTTFAPSIIRADVAEDQQEVSAQAYDTITDLRQSFLRAKKENQKALRGANAELAQLLKQGDQVVKSPWASFQFGTGYTNNDWGTSYKGRGGKKLEYYSRTNDLTKYVFDASKHQYGATNLNLPRNQEPNTLAITPANIHEPYRPYDVTKLDAIALPTAPTFSVDMAAPTGVTTYDFTYHGRTINRQPETEVIRSTSVNNAVRFNNLNASYATYTTNTNDTLTTNSTTGNANTASLANNGTFDIGATNKRLYDTAWWWSSYQGWEFANVSDIEGGDFKIYDHHTGNSVSYVTGTFDTDSTYSTVKVNGSGNYGGRDDASYSAPSASYSGNSVADLQNNARFHARVTYANLHPEVHWNTILTLTDSQLGLSFGYTHGANHDYAATLNTTEISWRDGITGNVTYTPSSWTGTAYNHKADSSIKVSAGNVNLKSNKFTIIDGNSRTRAGLHVAGGTVNMIGGNTFNVNGVNSKKNDGALVASGTLNTSGINAFNISGSENNGLEITGGTVKMRDTTNFDVGGTQNNNGIFLNGGDLDAEGVHMTLSSGKEQIGLNNTNGSSAKLKTGSFSITNGVTESNAVYANKDTTTESIAYTIRTTTGKNNGVYLNGSAKLDDKTSTYTVEGSENNGIYSASSGLASIQAPTFDVSGNKNNGISVNGTGGATIDSTSLRAVTDPNFKITGTNNNGIVLRAAGPLKVEKMRFDISGTSANPAVPNPGAQNNGILLRAAGKADVTDSVFTVTGRDNSAIWGESGAAINTTRNTFELGGTETNGVYLNAASTALTDVNSNFNITGTNSNGIYAKEGSADLQGTRMTVNGTNNNGLIVFQSATPVKVQNSARRAGFTVNNNNNGIFVTDSATVDLINNTDFVVSDSGIGILAGDSNGVGTVTKIENSTFDVKGTNANNSADKTGTGIYMYQGVVTVENNVTMTGDKNDIFITIRNRDHDNTIDFKGANGTNRALLEATGENNVGINIQNGDSAATVGKTVTVDTSTNKGWNVNFVGDNNTGIKNNYFADTLSVKNTVSSLPTSLTDSGVMTITGENATGFVNLGYVDAATLQLDYLNLSGLHSVGAAFLNNNYTRGGTAPLVNPSTVNTGIFNGSNAVKLQGVIGGTEGGTIDSLNSVGVYANTGQSTLLSKSSVGYSNGGGTALTDLEVELQLGFQRNARKSTLIWAENGTKVKVHANSYAGNVVGNTSDGITYSGGTPKFGYDETEDIVVSTGSTIGYATGYLDTNEHGYIPSAGPRYQASEIEFEDGVDMLAKEGTALHVDKGGKITAKDVRAGGYESILAYATGKHPIGGTSSAIEIDGQIVAADNNLLGKNYNVTGKVVQNDLPKTYNNVGAYASNGGKVTIKTATVSDTTLEVSGGSLDPTADATKSLIFGMAAYATGNGSEVKFENSKTTVVTGIYGGLYATDKGQIEFAGDIINQNNAGLTQSTKIAGSATGIAADETRKARGNNATDHTGTVVANDHKNVTPFYVKRTTEGDVTADDSGIVFNATTGIDMYDGILYTGNQYNVNGYTAGGTYNTIRDYYKDAARPTGAELDKWKMAKYRGMSNVTAAIMSDNYAVELGVINQAAGLKWNELGNTNPKATADADNYIGSIGEKYAGGMMLTNESNGATSGGTQVGNRFHSTLINSDITIDKKASAVTVNLENEDLTDDGNINDSKKVDPFNDIKMESTLVTIGKDATVKGDVANRYRAGQGLNMANSLNRWETPDNVRSRWIKTGNDKSGYINKGKIDVFGGTKTNGITGVNVAFGTVQNLNDGGTDSKGEIQIDHGHAIHATDGSSIKNTGKITVTGKLTQLSYLRGLTESAEGAPSGNNYGIVGISDTDAIAYNVNDDWSQKINTLNIEHSGEHAITKVEGELAVGIYGENRNNAKASDIKIKYDTSDRSKAGIDVSNANVTSSEARGVGIALVNGSSTTYADGALDAGGEITLKGFGGTAGNDADTANDILTGKNGVGIYAESAEINVDSDNFVVKTEDNGIGLWAMDDTVVARGTQDKKFIYNYYGKNDKNGFAMAFGGKNTNATTAANYMDILFSNTADATNVNLKNEDATGRTGTNKGIVGLLVNTNDAADKVTNYGKIEEDASSKTNLKAYGALVNKGTFINHGDITLNASLMNDKNSTITTADMKKVNVGILANDHSERARDNSYIENYANITIGQDADSKNNVGSWAIYGYNIKTGAKLDGTEVVYKINRNSNGIYSGDGNVDIQRGTVLKVGNDTVLGHVRPTQVVNGITMPSRQPDTTGTGYADPDDLLSGLDNPRERDSAVGVYINNNRGLSDEVRTINVAADMDIDRFSHGIVLAEKTGGALTTVNMGTSAATAPKIRLAYSTANNPGGQVHSTKPYEPEIFSEEVNEQGNAVYYYSADTNSKAKSYANVTMDGDYNTAYFTKGSVTNYGNIDLRSQYDLELRNNDPDHIPVGYGSVGIISENTTDPSINEGKIITGLSDTQNMMYSVGMGAGRNFYRIDPSTRERVYDRTEGQGYVVNNGEIVVQEENGIGMLATGRGSKAINNGTIRLVGKNGVGMYIDREAIGENHGTITGDAENLKGVVAINGGYIKNYGTIKVEGTGSYGIVTDSSKFTLDANGDPIAYHTDTSSAEYRNGTTAGQANGHGGTDLYGGTETSIEEGTTGNPKTTGVGTTITRPNIVPLTSVTIDGVEQPIFNFNNDADVVGKQAENILVTSSVQTVATGATELQIPIWLRARDEYGNPAWPRYNSPQMSEVTRIGMYVDTSGVRYTNPIDGIENLTRLGKVNLYFGPEITEYTNSKAIRIANNRREVSPGNFVVEENNILKPFNDALRRLPGGATINPLSSSLTWQVSANIDDNNQITELVMSKVPYHSFAFDGDKRLINFTNNLDNIYEIARPGSEEKMIFNKLNSIGNGEGHILAQAFDQMRGHIYGGIQQRTNATSNLLTDELAQLRSENNASKDSNKIKAFGRREEYKTDTAGLPDWHSNAGGFVYLHEDETVKLGDRSGWYAGVVNNYFTFKDLARSYENQAMLKTGIFKQTPLDEDGTFTFTIGGDAFFGKTNTKRRFWVVDKEFRAKSDYYTYGADINAKLEKEFRLTEGFSIVPNVGLDLQYGRFSTVNEDGDMALKIKSDDYYSVKPRAGVDFRYSQPVFKKSNFVASVGLAYETELGRLNDVDNEAKIKGAWTDYYSIKGDKEDRKGNFKSDLKLGLDNGRLGFTVNTGYDTKGHNFRAGLGLRALF